ncbi:MAG: pentapeptide repeat-containing protein [Kribbellaceae bacterium]|nr:pentapeptide repeat-containing protein [Kribbellaceae bacterium]
MRVGRLTLWALPVVLIAVLAAASALWGPVVAAVILGFVVALSAGWALGLGLDPAKTIRRSGSDAPDAPVGSRSSSLLSGADLSGADLSGADLRGLDLRDVTLHKAILRGADLRGARLSQEPDK